MVVLVRVVLVVGHHLVVPWVMLLAGAWYFCTFPASFRLPFMAILVMELGVFAEPGLQVVDRRRE